MSEAKSPGAWLEKADDHLAQFTGVVADSKRKLTEEAVELTKKTAQGAHLALKACELAVAKLRYDNTPEDLATNDLHKQATQALRRKCKDEAQKAKGTIFFLQRKTELRDIDYLSYLTQLIDDDHNDGVDNDGIDNNGIDNNGIDNNGIDNNGIDNIDINGDGVDSECGGLSTSPLCQSNCLAATPTSTIRAGSSRRVIADPPANPPVDPTANPPVDPTAYHLSAFRHHPTGVEETARCHPHRGPPCTYPVDLTPSPSSTSPPPSMRTAFRYPISSCSTHSTTTTVLSRSLESPASS
jgi:hypothetical protein